LVSEGVTQVSVARTRAGAIGGGLGAGAAAANGRIDREAVLAALAEIPDPELPMLSIVDLGMIGDVTVDPVSGVISVELLPTFVGCPAIEMIRTNVAERLTAFGTPVRIDTSFRIPWTSDRISAAGLAALATHGIAAPSAPDAVHCPWCRSDHVIMDSSFGPTQCRSLYYCRACRQPFEAMKPV
jgi:ring-1,2-phenylacetyl-CoA epoxidase subunit PaaD